MTNIIFSEKVIKLIELMEKLLQEEIDGACECWEAVSFTTLITEERAAKLNISKNEILEFSKQLKNLNLKFNVYAAIEDQWDDYNELLAYKYNLDSKDADILSHAINTIVRFKKNLNKEQKELLKMVT